MRPIPIAIAAVLALVPAQPPQAQPPQATPTFRANTQVVEVDVRVFKDGQFVTDLHRDDFELTEDGVPQQLQTLTLIGASRPAVPEAASVSLPPPVTPPPPSAWLFVFDTTHLSSTSLNRTRQAARDFIATRLHPGDMAAVVDNGRVVNGRLTSDHEEVAKAVAALRVDGDVRIRMAELKSSWPRIQDEGEVMELNRGDRDTLQRVIARACADDPDQCKADSPDAPIMNKAQRMFDDIERQSHATLAGLDTLARGLARMPGPKTIVFFSDGVVVSHLESELDHVAGQAARAGVHIYSVDARGTARGGAAADVEQVAAESANTVSAHFDIAEDGPNSLAIDTGGFAVRGNDFGKALDRIQDDARAYYVIGYVPANGASDGKFRAIGVKVNRQGVKVRARKGYLALPPSQLLAPVALPALEAPAVTAVVGAPASLAAPERLTALEHGRPAPPSAERAGGEGIDVSRAVTALGRAGSADSDADRGWSAYQRGDIATAAREMKKAVAQPGALPWMQFVLGLSEFGQGRYAEAISAWETVRADVPAFEAVYFSLADAYAMKVNYSSAIQVLKEGVPRWPDDPELLNALGVLQIRRKAVDEAIRTFTQATVVAPEDPYAYFNLGRAYQLKVDATAHFNTVSRSWTGGDQERRLSTEWYTKYLAIGGPYDKEAHDAITALGWKPRMPPAPPA